MKIAVVAPHCCIRVMKECEVLYNKGYDLYLVTEAQVNSRLFKAVLFYNSISQLEEALKLLSGVVDIFHYHNEPSIPIVVIRETIPNARIVFDYHDSNYWRTPEKYLNDNFICWSNEDVAVESSDAFIFPSQSCQNFMVNRGRIGSKPSIVIPPAFPLSYMRYYQGGYSGGIVSQGGHSYFKENEGEHWRDFTELYSKLIKSGKRVFAYSKSFSVENINEPLTKHYSDIGVSVGNLSYDALLNRMSSFDWNLVGNCNKTTVWEFASPNKFYDALAGGVPSVVINCPEIEKIVNEYKFGIVVKSVDELIERWDEHTICRKNLFLHRKKFCMENYISRIEDLYKGLL